MRAYSASNSQPALNREATDFGLLSAYVTNLSYCRDS
jgi:hypothetical protein